MNKENQIKDFKIHLDDCADYIDGHVTWSVNNIEKKLYWCATYDYIQEFDPYNALREDFLQFNDDWEILDLDDTRFDEDKNVYRCKYNDKEFEITSEEYKEIFDKVEDQLFEWKEDETIYSSEEEEEEEEGE